MSLATHSPIPSGWYPDPRGAQQQRWWNGSDWTDDTAPFRPVLTIVPNVVTGPIAVQADPYAGLATPSLLEESEPVVAVAEVTTAAVTTAAKAPVQLMLSGNVVPTFPTVNYTLEWSPEVLGSADLPTTNDNIYYQPFGMISVPHARVAAGGAGKGSASKWLLALIPVGVVAAAAVAIAAVPELSSAVAQITGF